VLQIQGREEAFCCEGCRAVCAAILEAGQGDYYRFREQPGGSPGGATDPDLLKSLSLYDRPELQSSFVRRGSGWLEATLALEEVRCAACLWLNEQHLRGLDGVLDATVDFTTHRARVRWDPERIALSEILRAIAAIGYVARPLDPRRMQELAPVRKRRNVERILFAGIVGMPVMQVAFATYLMGEPGPSGALPMWVTIGRWSSLVATAAILVYSAQDFFIGAWRDLRHRRLGMDVPIVIGLAVAWWGSAYATWTARGEVYYDSIVMFVVLVLLARHLELRSRLDAVRALDRLARVVPRTARFLDERGTERWVPVTDLAPGDRIRVRPGETVPVDTQVVEGQGDVDESLLTGEARPLHKTLGDGVPGGALNLDQPLTLRVVRSWEASAPAQIQRLVEEGARLRPRYALLAERAATAFVAVVLGIAVLAAAFWWWYEPERLIPNLVAVLIVTCPCALALATPVAATLAAARLIQAGVLGLRMDKLETLATAEVLACDKTGTLTEGRPRVVEVATLHPMPAGLDPMDLAAALESASEHPLARAFRSARPEAPLPAEALRNHPGQGVSGEVLGRRWRLGQPRFVLGGRAPGPLLTERIRALRQAGHTVLLLAPVGGDPVALFGVTDPPREGLPAFLSAMRRSGIRRIAVLSGDHAQGVARFAARLGIGEAHGELRPVDKLRWIRQVQGRGQRVLMVGDGINDAPVLAAADVSVSFGSATEAAQASSDFLILGRSLSVLGQARDLARRTRRIVLQNLLWAAGYNLAAVPLAAAGFVPPWAAAVGMSLSSLLVVGNALRLRAPKTAGGGVSRSTGFELTPSESARNSSPRVALH